MERHVTLFLILFMQGAVVSYLNLKTVRDSLKIPYKHALWQCLGVIAACSVLYSYIPPREVMAVVLISSMCIAGWVYMMIVSNENNGKLLFVLSVSTASLLLCNTAWLILTDVAARFTVYDDAAWYNILLLGVPLLAFLPVFTRLLKKLWDNSAGLSGLSWYRFSMVPLAFITLYIVSYVLRSLGDINPVAEHVIMVTISVCFLATASQFIFALEKASSATRYAENLRLVETQIAMQSARMEEISAHQNERKRMRHDFRQHLSVFYTFLSENRLDAAKKYLEQYVKEIPDIDDAAICENEIVDTITRYYLGIARKNGIEVSTNLSLPRETGFPGTELCVLLGNLFENAIEGCQKQPGHETRSIDLHVFPKGNSLLVSLKNTYGGKLLTNAAGDFLSTKQTGGGSGILSIRSIAEKHGGRARFYNENHLFISEVLMYDREPR